MKMAQPLITFCMALSEKHIIYTWRLNTHLFITGKDKMINMTFENEKDLTKEITNTEL